MIDWDADRARLSQARVWYIEACANYCRQAYANYRRIYDEHEGIAAPELTQAEKAKDEALRQYQQVLKLAVEADRSGRLMRGPRLLLADDHELVVDGLRKLLEPEFTVVESVCDGRAAVEAFRRLNPDLLVLDIGLPVMNGLAVARQVKQSAPDARILFVTMYTSRIYIEEALRIGGAGYLLKHSAARELREAVHTVLAGGIYVSPWIMERLGPIKLSTETPALTPRQRQVLQLITEGKTMKEIGEILGISARTVEFHKNAITDLLGLHSTAELTRYALTQGDGELKPDSMTGPADSRE